jgi:hypothetical protein
MKRRCVLLVLPCLLVLSVGCGSNGTITGTVTYNGTPIPEGSIMFHPDNGAPSVSTTIVDGKYTAEKVPPGPAKVSVVSVFTEAMDVTPMQRAMQGGLKPKEGAEIPEGARKLMAGAAQAKKGVKIPDDYASPSTSGLSYTVQGGKQNHDIDLK